MHPHPLFPAKGRATQHMHHRYLASVIAAALATSTSAIAGPGSTSDAQYLLYLPSTAANVDHAAIIKAFDQAGYTVETLPFAGENDVAYARRVAGEVRALIAKGVNPARISVVGAGGGSQIGALASAATGDSHVNYVLLGGCDVLLRQRYSFRMSGRVLGVRDAADHGSHSCRPLWEGSPKVSDRRDIVLRTPYGVALFDQPHKEWMQTVVEWTSHGRVEVGGVRVGAVISPRRHSGGASE